MSGGNNMAESTDLDTERYQEGIWEGTLPLYLGEENAKQLLLKCLKQTSELHQPPLSEFLATDPEVRVRFPALPDFLKVVGLERPPLWSSGQSSWLQIRRPGFDSRHYQKKKMQWVWNGVHSASWVQTEELLDRKAAVPV
jgi:hypothetical protein